MSPRARLGITLLAPPLVLVGLEFGLSLAGFEQSRLDLPITVFTRARDEAMRHDLDLHEFDDHQLWALRPGAVVEEDGQAINALGLRGPPVPVERTPGVLRVALLGESAVFGMHLPWEDTLAARLQAALGQAGRPAEVLNAGVIGHTIAQGLQRYRRVVRPLAPDVVVAAYGAINEHSPAVYFPDADKIALQSEQAAGWRRAVLWARDHSRVVQLVDRLLIAARGGERAVRQAHAQARLDQLDAKAGYGRAEWPGERRVPLERFPGLATELARVVEADGAALILVSMPRAPRLEQGRSVLALYSQALEDVAGELELPLCDMRAEQRAFIAAGGDPAALYVPGNTLHPSVELNEQIVQRLLPLVLQAAD